jgi:hypothetical protein
MSLKPLNPKVEEKKIHEEFSTRYQELTGNVSSGQIQSESVGAGGLAHEMPNPYEALPVLPFSDPTQQVVLLNITHRQQIPRSKLPGFRICGAFDSVNKLKQHALNIGGPSAYGGANLIKADVHKKFLICSSLDKQQNSDYVLKKIEDLSAKYTQTLKFHTEEFNENKSKRQQGQTGLSAHEKVKKISSRKQLLDKKFEEESGKGSETGDVSRNAEVRNQTVAVVTIIEDTSPAVLNGTEDPEPIVIVWGCFENEAQAKHYIYSTASKFVKDVMLDVVNMYEWVFPTEISKRVDELTEEFRNPSLNKVMNSRKSQKKSVMNYSEWCKTEGQEPAMLEISAIKETSESTEVKTEVRKTEDFKVSVSTKEEKSESDDWKQVNTAKLSAVAELYKETKFSDTPDEKTPKLQPQTGSPHLITEIDEKSTTTPTSNETPQTPKTPKTPLAAQTAPKKKGRPRKNV